MLMWTPSARRSNRAEPIRFGTALKGKAGRRPWLGTAILIAGTLAVALTSYSLSMKVSGERRATERLARENSRLEQQLKGLDAELRVRMRLPQLQRWNDEILAMTPITAQQYLSAPVQLAAYSVATPAAQPALSLAVADRAARADMPPRLIMAHAAPPAGNAPPQAQPTPVAEPPAPALDPLLVAAVEAAIAAPAPVDLLQQASLDAPPAPPPGREP